MTYETQFQNPYRARPGRPRVEHTGISSYGVQNQNSWSTQADGLQPIIPPSRGFQVQPSVGSQPKQAGDPWNWGNDNTDNGNDAWNWSVDQQSESQGSPQQAQQPHFVSSYPNNMESLPNPIEESYYRSVNGNNRTVSNQAHTGSGGTTPRTSQTRETTPQQTKSYSNYANYSTNQQQPPRPTSANPNTGSDHSQWPSNQQQPQFVNQTDRKAAHFNAYFQPNPPVYDPKSPGPAALPPQPLHPHQPVVNNYNWNNPEQQNIVLQQQNWQTHSDAASSEYWQDDANVEADGQYESAKNQWRQTARHSQTPHTFPLAVNVTGNQWQNQSRHADPLTQKQQQQQLPVAHYLPSSTTTWNPPKSLNASQSWQQIPLHGEWPGGLAGQWSQQRSTLETSRDLPEVAEGTSEEETMTGRMTPKEWSQMKQPLAHFASSTASTTSGSIPNLSSGADQLDDRKKSFATSVASSMSLNDSPTEGKAPTLYQAQVIGERGNWTAVSETNSTSDNSDNILVQVFIIC